MRFYELRDDEKFFKAEWGEGMDFEVIDLQCPEGHRLVKRKEQLIIKMPSSKIGDFVWTWYHECLVTDRVAQLFKEARFTGYELRPVIVSKVYKYYTYKDIGFIEDKAVGIKKVIRDRNPQHIPKLWELVVTGKGGEAHPKSGIRLIKKCKFCGAEEYTGFGKGLFIDESQWDGSDFFTVWPLPKFIIITERVKKFIEEKKLTNCKITPVEELVGKGEKETLSPGRRE